MQRKADGDQALLSRWDQLMVSVERPYALAIIREKNRYIRAAADRFPALGRLDDGEFTDHSLLMVMLAERYQGRAIRLATRFALGGFKQFVGMERKDAWEALWVYLIRKWISEWGASRAKETAATTRADLQRVIDAAVAPDVEFNPVAVATSLLKVRDISPMRAVTIAQTEVHNAMMYASQEGASKLSRDNGVQLNKRWLPVIDERTRVNHAVMAGHPAIPLDADFVVGGEKMQRPGDPRGSRANVIRCRCALAYEVVE